MEKITKRIENMGHDEKYSFLYNGINELYNINLDSIIINKFDLKELKKAYIENEHLNSIKLTIWDSLANSYNILGKIAGVYKNKTNYKGGASLSECVCLLKYIAKKLIENVED